MILFLRGHVRDSFRTPWLRQWVESVCKTYPTCHIYIHTWSVVQNAVSWRSMPNIPIPVTEPMIRTYFSSVGQHIENIVIENDQTISLTGRVHGTVSQTNCPMLGWKRMWYGQRQGLQTIFEPEDTMIWNVRLDVFSNHCALKPTFVSRAMQKYRKPPTSVWFLQEELLKGCDNVMVGTLKDMQEFVSYLYEHLDVLVMRYRVKHQEYIVYYEALRRMAQKRAKKGLN